MLVILIKGVFMRNSFFIKLEGENKIFQNLKYEGIGTLATAKKIIKRLSKVTGYEKGDITTFNENCTVKSWLVFRNGEFIKQEV